MVEAALAGDKAFGEDGLALLQEYHEPAEAEVCWTVAFDSNHNHNPNPLNLLEIYRVWHLNGKVQCGVATKFLENSHGEEFGGEHMQCIMRLQLNLNLIITSTLAVA